MRDTQLDVDGLWAAVNPNDVGLVPCITQDLRTRAVLMLAWVSKEALAETLESGWATYYSRSRQALWIKGEVSGNRQKIVHVRLDCDGDTLLYLVEAILPACHEGTDTCFSRRRVRGRWKRDPVEIAQSPQEKAAVIEHLETLIDARVAADTHIRPSYTKQLMEGGVEAQVAKISEESDELVQALKEAPDDRVVSESADVLYHLAVALKARDLSFLDVFGELERRLGASGIDEKTSRDPPASHS